MPGGARLCQVAVRAEDQQVCVGLRLLRQELRLGRSMRFPAGGDWLCGEGGVTALPF